MDIDIEADNVDIKEMVPAAKHGIWDKVFEVLNRKPYLINCIPQGRAWGVLHQAVYWKRQDIINRLLLYPACDVLITTKPCRLEDMDPGSTPRKIAEKNRYIDIETTLAYEEKHHRNQRFGNEIPHMVSRIEGEEMFDKLPLVLLELVMYKDSLVDPHTDVKVHMTDLMKKITKNDDDTWKKHEKQVHNTLYGVCRAAAEEIKGATTEAKYFEELIKLYTGNLVYKEVNTAFAREFVKHYKPQAQDLALGLYALLLDVTISFWEKLNKVSNKTYRGIKSDLTHKFQAEQEIMFTTILSSSMSEDVANCFKGYPGTMLIFDNSAQSFFRPRDIERISHITDERECVYPVGSEFKVTSVDKIQRVVELRLI